MMKKKELPIGPDAVLLGIYFALVPIYKILILPNGKSIINYLVYSVIAACLLQGYLVKRSLIIKWDLIWPVLLLFGWTSLTLLWTNYPAAVLLSLINLGRFCAMLLIVGSKKWTEKEKNFFILVLILSSTFYALRLVRYASVYRRATIFLVYNDNVKKVDPNFLSCNIGLGAIAAFYFFLGRKKRFLKWASLACLIIILTGIISTGSRGGLFALIAGIGFLFYKCSKTDVTTRRMFLFFAGIILILYWAIFDQNILHNTIIQERFNLQNFPGVSGRVEIWRQYLDLLYHRPFGIFIGYGSNCAPLELEDFLISNQSSSIHNDYLSVLSETGIPGILFTIIFVREIWIQSCRNMDVLGRACIVLMLVASMSLPIFRTYWWWDAMLITLIGLGNSHGEYSGIKDPRVSFLPEDD